MKQQLASIQSIAAIGPPSGVKIFRQLAEGLGYQVLAGENFAQLDISEKLPPICVFILWNKDKSISERLLECKEFPSALKKCPTVAVISKQEAVKALDHSADYFLVQPFEPIELLQALAILCNNTATSLQPSGALEEAIASRIESIENSQQLLLGLLPHSQTRTSYGLEIALKQLESCAEILRSALYTKSLDAKGSPGDVQNFSPYALISEIADLYKKRASLREIGFDLFFLTPIPSVLEGSASAIHYLLQACLNRSLHSLDEGRLSLAVAFNEVESCLKLEIISPGGAEAVIINDKSFKTLLSACAGACEVQSIPNLGTQIRLSLPLRPVSKLSSVSTLQVAQGVIGKNILGSPNQTPESNFDLSVLRNYQGLITILSNNSLMRDYIEAIRSISPIRFKCFRSERSFLVSIRSTPPDVLVIDHESAAAAEWVLSNLGDLHRYIPKIVVLGALENQIEERLDAHNITARFTRPAQFLTILQKCIEFLSSTYRDNLVATSMATPERVESKAQMQSTPLDLQSPPIDKRNISTESSLALLDPDQISNIEEFIETLSPQLTLINTWLANKDYQKVTFLANQLGGTACLCGLKELGERFLDLEQASKEHDGVKAEQFFTAVRSLYQCYEGAHQLAPSTSEIVGSASPTTALEVAPLTSQSPPLKPISSAILNDCPDLLPLVLEFVTSLDEHLQRIECAATELHWDALRAVAHETSGVASMYGYPDYSKIAKKLQLAAEAKESAVVAPLVAELKSLAQAMKEAKREMQSSLGKQS